MRLDELEFVETIGTTKKAVVRLHKGIFLNVYQTRDTNWHIFVHGAFVFTPHYTELDALTAQCVLNELLKGVTDETIQSSDAQE